MEKLTFIAGENIVLVDGEIVILNRDIASFGIVYDWNYSQIVSYNSEAEQHGIKYSVILASTKQLEGIKQLDRSLFVKPVDVEELAEKHANEVYDFIYRKHVDVTPAEFKNCKNDFKKGYNAKKAEFTEQELIEAMYDAREYPNKRNNHNTFADFVKSYLAKLKPLTLPKQIITDQEYNLIEVKF